MTKAQEELVQGRLIDCYEEIAKEWYTPFNQLLKLDVNSIRCSYSLEVYWKCPRCQKVYWMSPRNRIFKNYRNQEPCYHCRGRRQLRAFTV